MKRNPWPWIGIVAGLLLATIPALAREAMQQQRLTVHYLPVSEAEALVSSVLSDRGTVVALTSRRLLIVRDDAAHLKKAKQQLAQFDRPPKQYRITLALVESSRVTTQSLQAAASLPGDWLQLRGSERTSHYHGNQSWSLLLQAGSEGMISVGEIQPYRQKIRAWLAGYGLLEQESVNLVTLRAGFFVRMQPAGNDRVELDLMPWLSRSQPGMPANAKPELLIGLGTAGNINQRPGATDPQLRLNAAPRLAMPKPVRIASAATHLTVKVGEAVDLLADHGESRLLTRTLLGRHSSSGDQTMVLRLRVEPATVER